MDVQSPGNYLSQTGKQSSEKQLYKLWGERLHPEQQWPGSWEMPLLLALGCSALATKQKQAAISEGEQPEPSNHILGKVRPSSPELYAEP